MIGFGRIGRVHAECCSPGSGCLGVGVRPAPAFGGDVASELGVPAADSVEASSRGDIDAVAVCSSTDTHVDVMIAAAEAGKAILCEKPISLELDEVDRALSRSNAQASPSDRVQPPLRSGSASVRDAVASGSVGDVTSCGSRAAIRRRRR